jgi:hypothetical protein
MKSLFTHLSYFSSLLLIIFVQSGFSQCSLLDNSQGTLFITYETTARVKIDGEDKLQDGVIFRLHNNSTCAVFITAGSANKFYKPLPANPTARQRGLREVDYDLPDGALVPDVQYRYESREGSSVSVGGDMFFGFKLVSGRSILFEVPFRHLDLRFASKIVLKFQYPWEQENRAKVTYSNTENLVTYWSGALPVEVKQKIRKR